MAHKDSITMRQAALVKAARSMVRLRYSLMADEELNEVLPRIEAAFTAAVQSGEMPSVAGLLAEFISEPAD